MTQTDTQQPSSGKGKAFFDRADQVAETGNWDFAIEMYLQGIEREPDNIHRGHQPLRNVSLNRTAKGGKPVGMIEKMKRGFGKDPMKNLINAEFLLAKEPGNETYMEHILKAAQALELKDVARWILMIMLESQKLATRKNRQRLDMISATYQQMEEINLALQAMQLALQADPKNEQLREIVKDLETRLTIKRGRFEEEGSFTKGVKDMAEQRKLIERDKITQSADYRKEQVDSCKAEYLKTPAVAGKVNAYVDALMSMGEDSYENEAIDVLTKAYADTSNYAFKFRIGEIKIRQGVKRCRRLKEAGDKAALAAALKEQLEFELGEFEERARNYPTDMALKFELGRRQFAAGKLDDAIGSLQQARRDMRHSLQAMSLLGQAFEKKGWFREAAETLEKALESEMTEDRMKDLRYHLGEVYEKMENWEKAQEQYSQVAQLDYNFKDVRNRLEEVRKKRG